MKYSYESQKKALKYLIENAPHDIEKFRNLYHVEIEGKSRATVSLRDILFSNVWTTNEKEELIKLYGHNDQKKEYSIWNYKTNERDAGYSVGMEGLPLIDECIRYHKFSGVEALLNLGNHISVATIRRIITYISDPAERYKYCELLVNHYKNQETIQAYCGDGNQCYLKNIPSLCDRYAEYNNDWNHNFWKTISSMRDICDTNDVELVKLFLETVKNINPLFQYAVESKNIEIVKLFIAKGADVNFQDLEFSSDGPAKTPIKIAIDNNDFEMMKFLHQNGADLNFVNTSERMQEWIQNLGEKEEKETHQYQYRWDRRDYLTWTKTPLEYAINIGPISINPDFMNNSVKNYEKECKNRMQIVNYLYENGATFDNSEINYTDLICFAIKADDFEATNYYFEEAFKNGKNVDFEKIIRFIHAPGLIKISFNSTHHYKTFEEGATPWFRICEKFLRLMDNNNYNYYVKFMLEKIFNEFSSWQFDKFRELIIDFSNLLPKEMQKEIPAVFGVNFSHLEEILNLGYDINSIKEDRNILMKYASSREFNVEILNKLISFGANVNYINPDTGESPLSCAIRKLHQYDFGEFIHNCNRETHQLYDLPEEYEKEDKALVKRLIELSSQEIILSEKVRDAVYEKIEPGLPQIIYDEILKALTQKGFKVENEYVKKSINALDECYVSEYITNPWGYLWNLYSNFDNQILENHVRRFPKIEDAKKIKYGTEESNNLFLLMSEHLKRNFITSIEDIKDFDALADKEEYVQDKQNDLLHEISRYIDYLDYRFILALIDECPLIDVASLSRVLLPEALESKDNKLCKQLIQRGATIVRYDESGNDITSTEYSENQIKRFSYLNKKYNPHQEYENLLEELGYSRVRTPKQKN